MNIKFSNSILFLVLACGAIIFAPDLIKKVDKDVSVNSSRTLPDPNLDNNVSDNSNQNLETIIPKNEESFPSDLEKLKALFAFKKWDYKTQGQGAKLTTTDCKTSISTLICDVVLSLPWSQNSFEIEISMGNNGSEWFVRSVRET